MHGYNELAKKSETLGEKVYCRIARDAAEDELRALGVSVERVEDKPTVLVLREHGPRVVFTEDDISLMRACVHERDGDPANEIAALRARAEKAERERDEALATCELLKCAGVERVTAAKARAERYREALVEAKGQLEDEWRAIDGYDYWREQAGQVAARVDAALSATEEDDRG